MNAIAHKTIQGEEQVRPARTVTFQDSNDALTQSTSRDETIKSEPSRLVGFQKDPQLQECQGQEQKAENKTAKTPIDLSDNINAGKRAKDLGEQLSSSNNREILTPSTTEPAAKTQRTTREWLTSAEKQLLDITANDAVLLQREVPNTTEEADLSDRNLRLQPVKETLSH